MIGDARLKHYKCPECGNDTTKPDNCYAVICPCNTMMRVIKPEPSKIVRTSVAPEIIFKGNWPGKSIKQGKEE